MNELKEGQTRTSFLGQLRKRKVFRVAVAYGVVAFVIVQLMDAVGGAIGLGDEEIRWILGALIIGFPTFVVGAWYFEVSDSGLHLDDRFRNLRFSRKAEVAVLTMLFGVALALAGYVFFYSGSGTTTTRIPSIAVLPFITLGTQNEILSEGLPDQLLARLDKLTEFNIMSRTSSFSDRFRGKDLKNIGAELGADHIVEGSVQQDGDRVLITAQLIHAETGRHVWSETYDRRINNLLDLEIEIAQNIARALKVVLSAGSRDAIAAVSTESPEAFDLNLQGWNYYWRPRSEVSLKASIELFERAMALDGDFQDPVVGKCQALLSLYRVTLDREYFQKGNQTCLQVASGFHRTTDVLIALGDFNRAVGNVDTALGYYTQALAQDDARADAYEGLANVHVANGQYDAAESVFKQALLSRAPPAMVHRGYGYFLSMRGRFAEASAQFEQVVALAPDDANALSNLGLAHYLLDRWEDAEKTWNRALAIKRDVPVLYNIATLFYYEKRYREAAGILEEVLAGHPDNFLAMGKLGAVYRELGDGEKAAAHFRQAYQVGVPEGHVEDARLYGWLASYKANLGEFDRAHQLVDSALAADEDNADAHYYRALTFALEEKFSEAQEALIRARALGYSTRMLDADPVLGEIERMRER